MDFDRMLRYCAALSVNNDRTWFHENHKWYDQARGDYIELLESVRFVIADAAPVLAPDILVGSVKDWMYRVARDMRFYKDQPPYIPAFRAYISADKKSWRPIGYYLRIEPGASCFGTGLWCGSTADSYAAREVISARAEEFGRALEYSGMELEGDRLKNIPRGFSQDDPAGEWLKFKNWSLVTAIPDDRLSADDSFEKLIHGLVERMEPMRQFLLEASR